MKFEAGCTYQDARGFFAFSDDGPYEAQNVRFADL